MGVTIRTREQRLDEYLVASARTGDRKAFELLPAGAAVAEDYKIAVVNAPRVLENALAGGAEDRTYARKLTGLGWQLHVDVMHRTVQVADGFGCGPSSRWRPSGFR